jgi:type IV secretory pathway VirB2 component (pilin)
MSIAPLYERFIAAVPAPDGIITQSADNATLHNIFNVVLGLAGAVAVAFIVFGGIKYMLSQGEANEVKKSKDTILYAIIGLVVVIVSFMLINYVIGKF